MCRFNAEHPLDRLIRVHKETNRVLRWVDWGNNGFAWITGNTSKKRWYFWENPVTILKTCDVCKKTSTPKKIRYHSPFGWANRKRYGLEYFDDINLLCWSCMNKIRPLEKLIDKSDELRIEINRHKRKLNESTKNNA